jgi:hypothetical protein
MQRYCALQYEGGKANRRFKGPGHGLAGLLRGYTGFEGRSVFAKTGIATSTANHSICVAHIASMTFSTAKARPSSPRLN